MVVMWVVRLVESLEAVLVAERDNEKADHLADARGGYLVVN